MHVRPGIVVGGLGRYDDRVAAGAIGQRKMSGTEAGDGIGVDDGDACDAGTQVRRSNRNSVQPRITNRVALKNNICAG